MNIAYAFNVMNGRAVLNNYFFNKVWASSTNPDHTMLLVNRTELIAFIRNIVASLTSELSEEVRNGNAVGMYLIHMDNIQWGIKAIDYLATEEFEFVYLTKD